MGMMRSFAPLPKHRAVADAKLTSSTLSATSSLTRMPVAYSISSNAASRRAFGPSSSSGVASSRSTSPRDERLGQALPDARCVEGGRGVVVDNALGNQEVEEALDRGDLARHRRRE